MMALTAGVHEVTGVGADLAAAEAEAAGARVFELVTTDASDRADFFDAVRAALPLDPPLTQSTNWNALADSLWNGIDSLDDQTIVITWRGAADLRVRSPRDFAMAMAVLGDVASSLGSWEHTNGEPKEVCVYVTRR